MNKREERRERRSAVAEQQAADAESNDESTSDEEARRRRASTIVTEEDQPNNAERQEATANEEELTELESRGEAVKEATAVVTSARRYAEPVDVEEKATDGEEKSGGMFHPSSVAVTVEQRNNRGQRSPEERGWFNPEASPSSPTELSGGTDAAGGGAHLTSERKRRPNVRMSERQKDMFITFDQSNPKRGGTASHQRYELYKKGRSIREALELGMTPADLKHDLLNNFARYLRKGEPEHQQRLSEEKREDELTGLREQLARSEGLLAKTRRAYEQQRSQHEQERQAYEYDLSEREQQAEIASWELDQEREERKVEVERARRELEREREQHRRIVREKLSPAQRRLFFEPEGEEQESEIDDSQSQIHNEGGSSPTKTGKGKYSKKVPKLTGIKSNYHCWELRMKSFLGQYSDHNMDMWEDVVNVSEARTKPNVKNEEWQELNNTAVFYLTEALPDNLLARVQRYQYAYEWIRALKPPTNFEAARMVKEEMKLIKKIDFKNVDEYVDAMEAGYARINACERGKKAMDEISYLLTVIEGAESDRRLLDCTKELYKIYDDNNQELNIDSIRKKLKLAEMRNR